MKSIQLSLICAICFFGCATKTQTGALTGGALGVGVGALAGGGSGALIGGAVGTIGGALVGSAMDAQDRENMEQNQPKTMNRINQGQPLTINDIVALSKEGIKDDTIIKLIDKTDSTYDLSTNQVIYLKNHGVSQKVINYMIST